VENNGQKQALAIHFDYETDLTISDFDGVGSTFSITAGTFEIASLKVLTPFTPQKAPPVYAGGAWCLMGGYRVGQ